ncbi:hypothetical protein [Leptolyngbya sp. FACHB-17]|uniref:hypothetical protein n=1 Tax=unclassified Leptolyngbya TaxID=2650499 RepID=UPI00167FF3CD|nr:hypothetical protein [Leptolyngbya sp. FACHB-17]MBD2080672.1 hypothetical protein [Leptolyngbya sp. FACHB-17]
MTSRRYQSQLFNFVTRQTQKLADKSATLLRHAKITTIWTTQILLYPIYAAFQGTRAIAQQIGQRVEKAVLRLRMSREEIAIDPDANLSDAPIQNVLTAVKRALVSGGNLPALRERHPLVLIGRFLARRDPENLAVSNPYQIQAIASLVDTRNLVLILDGNIILDTLTPEQQRQIEHRIRLELARYWQWRRKLYLKSAPLSLPEDRETLLPPIRVFRQLMAWVQASPVAIALNLFQEAELVTQPNELDWFVPSVPLSAWNPSSLIGRSPNPKNLTAWFAQLPNFSDLEALIWAAIRYFFGERTQFAPTQAGLPGAVEASPSLGFAHLFRKNLATHDAQEPLILEGRATGFEEPRSFSFRPSLRQQVREALRKLSGAIAIQRKSKIIVRQESLIVVQQETSIEQIYVEARSQLVSPESSSTEITSTHAHSPVARTAEPSEVVTAFDWIETPATHVEYVLTPWQKVLKWLDSGILWIEQRLVILWRWLTRRN